MRRTNATLGQALFGLPTASSKGCCGARAILPSLDGPSVGGGINEEVRMALDALDEASEVSVWLGASMHSVRLMDSECTAGGPVLPSCSD